MTATIHPEISDAVATAAVNAFYDNDIGPMDTSQRDAMRAAISAAVLADREEAAKEIARLKEELEQFPYGDVAALKTELFAARVELADARAAVSTAEEATRKALESVPVAMTAAVEKEREACAMALLNSASQLDRQAAMLDEICDADSAKMSEEMGLISACLKREATAIRARASEAGHE